MSQEIREKKMTQCTRVRRPGDGENNRAALHFLNNGGRAICSDIKKRKIKNKMVPAEKDNQQKTSEETHTYTGAIRERKTQPELHACQKKKGKNVRMDHSMRTRLFFITGRVHARVRALSIFVVGGPADTLTHWGQAVRRSSRPLSVSRRRLFTHCPLRLVG